MRHVLVVEGNGPFINLPIDSMGHPFLTRVGDYLVVHGKRYIVTSVLWHYDEKTVYVAAKEDDE